MKAIVVTDQAAGTAGMKLAELIHNEKRKTVYILCSIPLDIPIDELVTWKQLTGDRRLADALAECDEREWGALPLAAKELSRLFPALWATKKAAERWVAKTPPKAYRDIIRDWGVLNTYRPSGQTSWSKALVRHGADPRVALAAVLGVSAGDIRVREGAGSEPTASTDPSLRPRNPNPNTAGTKSRPAAPGFPAGGK